MQSLRNKILRPLFGLILISLAFTVFAKAGENTSQLIDYLTQEKINLSLAISDAKQDPNPENNQEYKELRQQNLAMIALNNAKISSFDNYLSNQKKLQLDFISRLKQLQQFSADAQPISTQQSINKIKTLKEINDKTIDLIQVNLNLAQSYQDLLTKNTHILDLWLAKNTLNQDIAQLHQKEDKLNEQIRSLFDNNLKLQKEIKETNDFKPLYNLESKLLLNNQVINLSQQKIAELNLQRRLLKADFLLLKTPDIRTLQHVTDIYKNSINQLSELEQSLKKMVMVLNKEQSHLIDLGLKQQYSRLLSVLNSRISGVSIQEQTLQEDLENHQQELKKQISTRQRLTVYRADVWPSIFIQIAHIPAQAYNYLQSLSIKTRDNYFWNNHLSNIFMWILIILTSLGFILLSKFIHYSETDKERSRLSGLLYSGLLTLITRNLGIIGVIVLLIEIFYFNQIPMLSYYLLINLLLVWMSFRSLILIARLGLLERVSDSSGKDVRLYYRLRWLLVIGGWITGLMVISYQLPLSVMLQDIFNRLFMFFLLTSSIVAWRSREPITYLLQPIITSKKIYFRNAMMLLVILTPISLFLTAIMGLIGYINLAWTLSRYLSQVLIIISAYVLMRGLLFDVLELFSEWMISKLSNGWLWIEVILKPLDKILRLLLVVLCFSLLFKLFDWHSDSVAAQRFYQLIAYPIVNVSGIYITLTSIFEFLILLSVFAWFSKWTREFCFRWLYRNTTDTGIRNSLSVFTQYAVILMGGFIALRVLGLDFSGMSMILGGLAVGMGFGLRDFASNIVGGLMLLIERPVREGDLISLGSYEGRVAHIGIRSMRVSSWDNMEVLIPNAETFNKPFTNWTHQDGIIRTVIPIKVSRADDPTIVQQLILDVLAIVPEIVDEPPAQVLLKKIDEALVEFEIRYFTNVHLHPRFEIRSKVLFAITAQFNAAGIHAPIPPFSVEFKREPHEDIIPPTKDAT